MNYANYAMLYWLAYAAGCVTGLGFGYMVGSVVRGMSQRR